jgi:hypothetical protein
MKPIGAISSTALFLLLGIPTLSYAGQEKPDKQEEKAKPEKQQQRSRPQPAQQDKSAKQQEQARQPRQQQDKPVKQDQQQAKGRQDQQRQPRQQQDQPAKQQQQARGQQDTQRQGHQQQASFSHAPQRTQQAQARQHAQPQLRLSERGSGRISDDRFRSNFGSNHHFRIGSPVLVGGYSRFQYGGYWFGFTEPWPSDWYYTDDVYVDYVDGAYYMYNPYYPGARFSITVVL